MHQAGGVTSITDEVRDVVDDQDVRVDDGACVPPAHRQVTDRQGIADVHGLPRTTQLRRGHGVGVQLGLRIRLDRAGAGPGSAWSGC